MSTKYPGGLISKTPPTPSGPYADSTAPGVWTLEQQAYWQKLGQWPTQGNVPPGAFIENLFSTYLYTGTSPTNQTINNGINLSANGGMVWFKGRNTSNASSAQVIVDTVRGRASTIKTYTTNGASTSSAGFDLVSFNSNGFTVGEPEQVSLNNSGLPTNYVSWTFQKQAKFFDIVTYTGTGSAQNISHNLGSTPGCIIIKCTSASATSWIVYHRGLDTPATNGLILNATTQQQGPGITSYWNSTAPTSTQFTVNTNGSVNASGQTFVAYLFAHDAGGFGLSGSENVISCGSFTTDGSGNASVNLGYEPQFWLYKPVGTGGWTIYDTMRGWSQTSIFNLNPNTSGAEGGGATTAFYPTSTGFDCVGSNLNPSETYIYIAIRKGPMAVPTLGTTVYNAISRSGTGATASVTGAGFPPDLVIDKVSNLNGTGVFWDKLRGPNIALTPTTTDTESTTTEELTSFNQDGFSAGTSPTFYINASGGYTYVNWLFKRAPSFFDEVCYTGTGSATTFAHNLAAVPELMIVKKRNTASGWIVYSAATGNSAILQLETTGAVQTSVTNWNNTTPTSSVFSVGTQGSVNASGGSYVAYLFATCTGVSKVGSYTGTGALTTINCGFTGSARFVLIKRTDTTGEWYVWDTVRGMTSGTDPSVRLNAIGSQSNANSVYSIATGFQLLASPAVDVNTSGGTYIYLAIA